MDRHRDERLEVFNPEQAAGDFFARYQPRCIGRGSEYLIYEIPGHQAVVKVPFGELVTAWQERHGINSASAVPASDTRAEMQARLAEERRRFAAVKQFFTAHEGGTETKLIVVPEKRFIAAVPVPPNILAQLLPPTADTAALSDQERLPVIIKVQPRVTELSDPHHYRSLSVVNDADLDYATGNDLYDERYERCNAALLVNPAAPLEITDFSQVQSANQHRLSPLHWLLQEAANTPKLKWVLEQLVGKMISFVEQGGEIIDFFGHNDIIFCSKNEDRQSDWQGMLIDPLYPHGQEITELARTIIKRFGQEYVPSFDRDNYEPLLQTDTEWEALLVFLNFARTVNGLARFLGLGRFLNIFPPEFTLDEKSQFLALALENMIRIRNVKRKDNGPGQ